MYAIRSYYVTPSQEIFRRLNTEEVDIAAFRQGHISLFAVRPLTVLRADALDLAGDDGGVHIRVITSYSIHYTKLYDGVALDYHLRSFPR